MKHPLCCVVLFGFITTAQSALAEETHHLCPLPEVIINHEIPHRIEYRLHDGNLMWISRITPSESPVSLLKVRTIRNKINEGFLSLICTYKTKAGKKMSMEANIPPPNTQCHIQGSGECNDPADCPLVCNAPLP